MADQDDARAGAEPHESPAQKEEPPPAKSHAELQEELERTRAENEALAARLAESPEAKAERRVRAWRMGVAIALIVIGCLVAAVAVPAVWLDRTLLDTNTWVDTVAPLAQDPSVQNYVADTATNALFEQVNVQQLAEQALPPKLVPFAPAIANAVRGFVSDQARAFTRSPQFYQAWVETNRVGHKAIVTALTPGSAGALSSSGGKVTLDIGMLVDSIKAKLVASGLSIVANVPTSALQGRELVLFESPYLAQAQAAIVGLGVAALLLPLLAVLLLAGGIALAVDRRKAVLWTGVGIVIAMFVPFEGLYLGQSVFVNQVTAAASKLPADVANVFYTTVLRNLFLAQKFILVVGLVMFVAAVVAGPAKWAVALREGVSHGMSRIGAGWDFGAFGEWVLANKPLLRGVGLAVGVVALVFVPAPKFSLLAWIVILEILWLLLIELFGRPRAVASGRAAGGED